MMHESSTIDSIEVGLRHWQDDLNEQVRAGRYELRLPAEAELEYDEWKDEMDYLFHRITAPGSRLTYMQRLVFFGDEPNPVFDLSNAD
jgi:hypothetical protein